MELAMIPVIVIILFVGFLLYGLESFVFPDTLMFGQLGAFISIAGIVLGFVLLGAKGGGITLGISTLILGLMHYFGSKKKEKNKKTIDDIYKGKHEDWK